MQRVLIVDDDPFTLEGIKRVVGRDFAIETADSGHEGLQKLQTRGPFATVVSDINMRGMSGIEFLEQARTVAPMTTRVVMTGYADRETMSDSINRASVFRFLHKPVSRKDFTSCLYASISVYQNALKSSGQTLPGSKQDAWIERALAEADFDQQLSLRFQPRVSTPTTAPLGVEALVRWHHPERGLITPDVFIPVSEKGPAIRRITEWVLLRACRAATEWRRLHGFHLSVSVNISPVLFSDPGLVDLVRSAIRWSGIDPGCLELEITEGLEIQNFDLVRDSISGLKSLGVRLSIDDFGTGFASMNYLQVLDVDCVKIDRSFVTNAPDNIKDQAILWATRDLSHRLGLKTVAEGVEDQRHEAIVQEVGIDEMQGYLFAKPLTSDDLVTWMHNYRHRVPSVAALPMLCNKRSELL